MMTKYERYLIWSLGLLLLALVLAGCRQAPDDPTEPAATVTASPRAAPEETAAVPTAAENDRQEGPALSEIEGFTEQGEPSQGDPAAPVVIEEFSSYQCPFCGRYFRESYPQVIANYVETGQVLYVFRDFPLPSQPQSPLAAEAANCAGQTGGGSAYWAMHDRLFERQAEWSGKGDAEAIFKEYAADLELDEATFSQCLDSGATREDVEADAAEGSQRGVRGTPTLFINGQPLVGAQPYSAIAQAIDAALAGETVGGAGTATPAPAATPTLTVPTTAPTPAAIAPADEAMIMGDPDAPVTIVEFSDYQCPFCSRYFQETWPKLKAEFVDTGRVRYVFKDFPLAELHPQAPKAHQAARCAGEQDAYWEMHDRLFAKQSEWGSRSKPAAVFKDFAAGLELEATAFETCLDSGQWADVVDADLAEGASLGVRGTPSFFINGYPLVGAQPYETFQMAIELAEQGRLGDAYR